MKVIEEIHLLSVSRTKLMLVSCDSLQTGDNNPRLLPQCLNACVPLIRRTQLCDHLDLILMWRSGSWVCLSVELAIQWIYCEGCLLCWNHILSPLLSLLHDGPSKRCPLENSYGNQYLRWLHDLAILFLATLMQLNVQLGLIWLWCVQWSICNF